MITIRLAWPVLVASAAACGAPSGSFGPVDPDGAGCPAWVTRGSGAFSDGGTRAFFGVGTASGLRNQGLARVTANNRARSEIGKIFTVYSASLMKDYMASTTAGGLNASSEEQYVGQAIKTFSAATLSGVQIVDHCVQPDGTWHALATLDLDNMQDLAKKAQQLRAGVREFVHKNAERSFDALAGEVSDPNPEGGQRPLPDPQPRDCSAILKVVQNPNPGGDCWVDERVSNREGKLTYPCQGGVAEASFGDVIFKGRAEPDNLDVVLRTQFDWEDGCRWESLQRIQGTLSTGRLSYDYAERPIQDQRGCAPACRARATISVTTP